MQPDAAVQPIHRRTASAPFGLDGGRGVGGAVSPFFSVSMRGRALVVAVLLAASSARAGDDSLIIVDDDAAVDAGGVVHFAPSPADGAAAADGDDEIIIIVDDNAAPLPVAPQVTGPLGRLWETWHIAADSDVMAAAQLADPEDGPWRLQAGVALESWLLPQPNLSFFGNGIARGGVDGTPEGRPWFFADLYELYARINVDRATVNLGRLVVPWGRTLATSFGDRLQPPDLRRGAPFPDAARQKQPQLGVQMKGALDVVGVEGVAFVSYEPSEGSLAAINQGGVRIGRYQTALVRAPSSAYRLLFDDDTSRLRERPALGQPTLAARAWRRIGEIDVSGSVTWQLDETPTLTLDPDVARVLADEALALRGLSPTPPPPPCNGDTQLACVGGRGALSYARTTTFGADASWGLGLVVVRAEAVVWPRLAGQGGKTALVVDEEGLRSVSLDLWQAAVAVEGQLGPAIDGSLELFNVSWDGVPRSARLWGVEALRQDEPGDAASSSVSTVRRVDRLAVASALGGALFGERVKWRLRGEAGLLQPDVLVSGEVRYRLPVFDLYLGGRGDLFTGLPGTPGWMRQDASLVGIFLGEGA
jgi:hypothetical protein